ncbi:hypothetical protein Ga0100231_014530 [Opitutaceae bacterium TAV4]|nr:hypothetical protein Ga0100231_014530 [Opitutaceae bacterium TAV4]RRJ99576.1 hypothetical protein Ga0100230_015725 [Opitutaceae bacterium TAV3]
MLQKTAITLLTCLFLIPSKFSFASEGSYEGRGKIRIDDFSDISSWMGWTKSGHAPGASVPFPFSFGSIKQPNRPDGYCGAFVYSFESLPAQALYEKNAAWQLQVKRPEAIEFDANPQGYECYLEFEFSRNKSKNTFKSPKIKLTGNQWQRYRVEFNDKNFPGFAPSNDLISLRSITFHGSARGRGTVLVDDICYIGDVFQNGSSAEAFPIYRKLESRPGKNVILDYNIANNLLTDSKVKATLKVYDQHRNEKADKSMELSLPASSLQKVSFNLGNDWEKGPYLVEIALELQDRKIRTYHKGWFAVFEPNNQRLNKTPMWFGIEDQEIRNAPAETALHLEWMKLLGVDMTRSGILGVLLEQARNRNIGFQGYENLLKPYADANLDILVEYASNFPGWIYSDKDRASRFHSTKRPPIDTTLMNAHFSKIGDLIARNPHIKYFEFINEPDISFHHDDQEVTDLYIQAVRATRETLRQRAPHVKITTGGGALTHPREKPDFSHRVFQEGSLYYDISAFHAHVDLDHYKKIVDLLDGWIDSTARPMANTESGFRSYYGDMHLALKQADVLVKKVAYSKWKNFEFYIWFMLQDYADKYLNADDSFGLVTVQNQPKPSFVAYNELIRQLANTRPLPDKQLDSRLESYGFRGEHEDIWVCWPRIRENEFSFTIKSSTPVTVGDIWGNQTTLDPREGVVNLNSFPLPFYIRTAQGEVQAATPLLNVVSGNTFVPGERKQLSINLNNPYNLPVSGKIGIGNERRKFSIPPSGTSTINLPILVGPDSEIGAQRVMANLNLESASDKRVLYQGDLLLSYDVALAVPSGNSSKTQITFQSVKQVRELAYDPYTPRWEGVENLSGILDVSWSSKGLHFVGKIRDDDIRFPNSGANIWKNDAIHIGIFGPQKQHIEVVVSNDSGGKATVWCVYSTNGKNGKWDVPVSVSAQQKSISYSFTIPFDKIGVRPRGGEEFKMSVLLSDNDSGSRLRVMEWGGGIEGERNPNLYRWIKLTP